MLVGLLGLAGVVVLLTSVSKANATSASESTVPRNPNLVPDPNHTRFGGGGKQLMLPPSDARVIGTSRVPDPRYDAKGGLDSLSVEQRTRGTAAAFFGTPLATSRVPASKPVSVMPATRQLRQPPSRFRVPLMARSTAVKTPTDDEGR